MRGHEPVASSKILPEDDVRPPSGCAEQLGYRRPMVVSVFDGDQAAIAKKAAGGGFDHPRAIKTVRTTPQRGVRIVVSHFWIDLVAVGLAQVGRVRDNEVDGPLQ